MLTKRHEMKNICLYFQIHHPFSFQTFRYLDIEGSKSYYDDWRIEREIQDAVTNYYLPTNEYLLKLIQRFKGKLKLSFNISGTALDLFLTYAPNLCNSFRQLADTGLVEFTGSTASHSIVSLSGKKNEFRESIKQHKERIANYFGQEPTLFVNTDLLFNNRIAGIVAEAGYPAILANGTKKVLHWRSPNYLYSSENLTPIKILFRNEKISNELSAILFNAKQAAAEPQLKEIFHSLNAVPPDEPITNIYLNYKALGGSGTPEKQHLFREFISKILADGSCRFSLASQTIEQYGAVSKIGIEEPICWTGDFHPDYYPGNELQKDAISQLFKLGKKVKSVNDINLTIDWKYLQSSDHFHLMDENHPDYQNNTLNPGIFKSKYEAYINYMNILSDFKQRLNLKLKSESRKSIAETRLNPEKKDKTGIPRK